MNKIHRILFVLHAFVGVGAIAGGLGAILNPKNPMGAPLDLLKNSPFNDFLIPGIILFAFLGLGNLMSAVTMCLKSRYQGYISSVLSWGLVIWIIVQCIMIRAIAALHVIFFIYGIVEGILATIILFEQHLFPTNIVINLYKKVTKEA